MFIFFGGTKKKSTYLVLMHLAFTNIIILFCKIISKTTAVFGLRNFLGDLGCQLVVWLEWVALDLSICTSGLLTVVQVSTMSPRGSVWVRFKPGSVWNILPVVPFFWILNSFISMNLFYYLRNSSSLNKSDVDASDSYRAFVAENQVTKWLFLTLMALRDTLLLMLMGAGFLQREHHKHVLHLPCSRLLYHTPEERAAQSVLLLMLCFLLFYWTEGVVTLYLNSYFDNRLMALNVLEILGLGYAAFIPLVLIHRENLTGFCHTC
ncbi:PREDICTED: vomeronasal type-1 receptor 2-like [Condylura cristata]|uniref:vomeronasal type-1 receptor 2-like n=1 Tax=Condylura cristata TaxID=143302 RepID=UPI0006434176|nr:PREDICTED: vomeronasal type-1 receptor 2-like [Condylura cristata]